LPVRAEYVEGSIIVFERDGASRLYSSGYYGKPLGVSKPKGPSFDEPLILDLIEALYLAEMGELVVQRDDRSMDPSELRAIGEATYSRFTALYKVYRDLRRRGFVVTPGIKFGSDFAVYKHGPGLEHAPFIVQVRASGDEFTATELVRSGRLATTVKKNFIVAIPDEVTDRVQYLVFSWMRL